MDSESFTARAVRHARIIRAKFALASGLGGDMLVQNISEWGIGVKCSSPHIFPGDEIEVELPVLGRVAGMVRWVAEGRLGVHFAEAIDMERLRFHQNRSLLCSPEKFSVAHRFEPVTRTYRPGLKSR